MANNKSVGLVITLALAGCVLLTSFIVADYLLHPPASHAVELDIGRDLVPIAQDPEFADATYWSVAADVAPTEEEATIQLQSYLEDKPVGCSLFQTPDANPQGEGFGETDVSAVPPGPFKTADSAVAISSTPTSTASADDDSEAAAIIREGMPNASDSEKQIWLEELKGMAPNEMKFLINQRKALGSSLLGDSMTDSTVELPTADLPKLEFPQSDHSAGNIETQTAADVYRQNIANSETVGYLQQYVIFGPSRNTAQFQTRIVQMTGRMIATKRPLDLAIEGEGFFRLTADDGSHFYCRSAPFVLEDGNIVLNDGSESPLVLSKCGLTLQQIADGDTSWVDAIVVYQFADASLLKQTGQSLLQPTKHSGEATVTTKGTVKTGTLEMPDFEVELEHEKLERLRRRSIADTIPAHYESN